VIWDEISDTWLQFRSPMRPPLSSILVAEHYLHHEAVSRRFRDFWDILPKKAFPALISMVGPTILQTMAKKQGKTRNHAIVAHQVPVWQGEDLDFQTFQLPAGSFVFELFAAVGCLIQLDGTRDIHGNSWRADDRLWTSVLFTSYKERLGLQWASGQANQHLAIVEGISDRALDFAAGRLIAQVRQPRTFWLPSALVTSLLSLREWALLDGHPFLGALHGSILTGVSIDGHWVLVEFKVRNVILQVHTWTGEDLSPDEAIMQLASQQQFGAPWILPHSAFLALPAVSLVMWSSGYSSSWMPIGHLERTASPR